MSDPTEWHREWAEKIAEAMHVDGLAHDDAYDCPLTGRIADPGIWIERVTNFIAAKLADLEGSPTPLQVLKMPRAQRDEIMRKSAEAMKGVDAESFDDFDDTSTPPSGEEELDIRCNSCGRAMDRDGDQHIDEVVPDDPNTHNLCGVAVLVEPPPEGLEEAVRGALITFVEKQFHPALKIKKEMDGHVLSADKYILAAVQPLFVQLNADREILVRCYKSCKNALEVRTSECTQLQAEVLEHRKHVAGLQSRLNTESRGHMDARRELQADNEALSQAVRWMWGHVNADNHSGTACRFCKARYNERHKVSCKYAIIGNRFCGYLWIEPKEALDE